MTREEALEKATAATRDFEFSRRLIAALDVLGILPLLEHHRWPPVEEKLHPGFAEGETGGRSTRPGQEEMPGLREQRIGETGTIAYNYRPPMKVDPDSQKPPPTTLPHADHADWIIDHMQAHIEFDRANIGGGIHASARTIARGIYDTLLTAGYRIYKN